METNSLELQVQRMYRFDGDRPLKAFVDIIVNDALLVKGIKVLEGKNGLFVSMPQEQAKDKKWYDSVRCLTQEIREHVTEVVLSAILQGARRGAANVDVVLLQRGDQGRDRRRIVDAERFDRLGGGAANAMVGIAERP